MSFFSIANTLLTMLGDEVYLSSSYKSLRNGSTKLRVCHLGIGSVDTRHGYPDLKIRAMGTAIHCLLPAVAIKIVHQAQLARATMCMLRESSHLLK